MSKFWCRVALGLTLASPLALVAAADTTYTVVVQDYRALPPYSQYADGEYTGFNRDLLDLFAESRGYTFQYVAYPVKRLFFEFVEGAGDLKYPDNANWALQIKGDTEIFYSDPVVEYVNGVMVKPSRTGAGVEAIEKLGLVAGWTPIGFQEEIAAGSVELFENNSYSGLLKQAIAGRIDGAYSNVATSRYYLRQELEQPDALIFDQSLPHVRSARVLSSIKHPHLIEEFNAFLQSHAEEIGELKLQHAVEDGVAIN